MNLGVRLGLRVRVSYLGVSGANGPIPDPASRPGHVICLLAADSCPWGGAAGCRWRLVVVSACCLLGRLQSGRPTRGWKRSGSVKSIFSSVSPNHIRMRLENFAGEVFTVSILERHFFSWGISMKVGRRWIVAGFHPHPKMETCLQRGGADPRTRFPLRHMARSRRRSEHGM